MPGDRRKARDLKLLDAVDAFPREPYSGAAWRVTREGRDPLQGARSRSRWCNDTCDVLYTSTERDGAIAEIYALLSSQPVFPAKIRARPFRLSVTASRILRLNDLPVLAQLGVNIGRYREREYTRTQEIADAAHFLGFQGLIAPSARWNCHTLVLFTDRLSPGDLELEISEDAIDWDAWRKAHKR